MNSSNQKSTNKSLLICCIGLLFIPLVVFLITELLGREALIRGRDGGVTYEILFSLVVGFIVIITTYKEIPSWWYRIVSAFSIVLLVIPIAIILAVLQELVRQLLSGYDQSYYNVGNWDLDPSMSISIIFIIEIIGFTFIKRKYFKAPVNRK